MDCFSLETTLHRKISGQQSFDVATAKELFNISRSEALDLMASTPDSELYEEVPVGKLKIKPAFSAYLAQLFEISGLELFLDQQEAWTFGLFPSTAGGRHFTLNIGRHEVAFSSLEFEIDPGDVTIEHMMVVDRLALEDQELHQWLSAHDGYIDEETYASALPDSCRVFFLGSFQDVFGVFKIDGFRRALIAYWFDALLRMRQKGSRSFFAKHHNYSAVLA